MLLVPGGMEYKISSHYFQQYTIEDAQIYYPCNFPIIFSDFSWPQITETSENGSPPQKRGAEKRGRELLYEGMIELTIILSLGLAQG